MHSLSLSLTSPGATGGDRATAVVRVSSSSTPAVVVRHAAPVAGNVVGSKRRVGDGVILPQHSPGGVGLHHHFLLDVNAVSDEPTAATGEVVVDTPEGGV